MDTGKIKQTIPLWVVSPKAMMFDDEIGTTTEFWAEDFRKLRDEGKI